MPPREMYQIQKRNNAIQLRFDFYIRSGMPRMLAYARTAEDFFLSEKRVRDIVKKR